jgi:hypothetical protein
MFLGYNYRIMLKYFLVFVLLLATSVLITGQYQKYTHNPAAPSENSGSAPIASTNPPKSTTDAEDAERDHPHWYLAFQVFGWPNGITVWALFLTLMALAEQTGQTRKAAEATQDSAKATEDAARAGQDSATAALKSVKLQQAQLRQWVETSDEWEVRCPQFRYGVTQTIIKFEFGITNPTPFPLDIIEINTRIGNEESRILSPNYELRPTEAFPMELETLVAGEHLASLRNNTLDVDITMVVTFKNVLRKRRVQEFYLTCRECGISKLRCTLYPRQRPHHPNQGQHQKAN